MAKEKSPAQPVMQPEEFAELRALAAKVMVQDVQLGRVLDLIILHLGHAQGLDPAAEDARLAAEARQTARDAEDAQLKAEAEALAVARASEDVAASTPEQQAALATVRAAQDAQIKADADARAQARAEEDALAQEGA